MEPCGWCEEMFVAAVMLLVLNIPSVILSQPACHFTVNCTIQGQNSCHVVPGNNSDGTYHRQLPDGPLLHQSDGARNVSIFSWYGETNSVTFKISWTPPSASEGLQPVTSYELGMAGYTPGHARLAFPGFYRIPVHNASAFTDDGNYIVTISCSCSSRLGLLRVMLTSVLGPPDTCNFRQWAALLNATDGLPTVLTPELNVTFYPERSYATDTLANASGAFQVWSSWSVQECFLERGSCSSPLERIALHPVMADGMIELKVAHEACKLYCLAMVVNAATKRAVYIPYVLPNSSSPRSSPFSSSRSDRTPTQSLWPGTRLHVAGQRMDQSTQTADSNRGIAAHPDWLTGSHAVALPGYQENGNASVENTSSRSSRTPAMTPSMTPRTSWPPQSPHLSSSAPSSSSSPRASDDNASDSSLLSTPLGEVDRKSSQSTQIADSYSTPAHPDGQTGNHVSTLLGDQQEDNATDITNRSSFEKPRSEFSETNSSVVFLSPSADPNQAGPGRSSVETNRSESTSPPWTSVFIAGGLASAAVVAFVLAARQMYRRRRKSLRWQEDRAVKDCTKCSCMYTDFHSVTDVDPDRRLASPHTSTRLFVLHRTVDKERLRNVHSFLHALEGALGGGVKLQEVVITSCAPAHFWASSSAGSDARREKVVLLLSSAVRNILKDVECNGGSYLNSWRRCIMQDIPCRTPFYFFVLLSHDVLKNDDVRFFRSALPVERIFEIGSWGCEQYHALVDELSRDFEVVAPPDSDNSSFLPPQTFCDVSSADVCHELHRLNDANDVRSVKSSTYSTCTV